MYEQPYQKHHIPVKVTDNMLKNVRTCRWLPGEILQL